MIILVTGATAGFGAAIARRFAANGHRIIAAGRRKERLDALQQELGQDRVHPLVLDVQDRAAVETAIKDLPAELAAIDVLVNNAGLAIGLEPAHETHLDGWEAMVDTNVKGLMYVTHAVLPGMVARNSGHIINMASTAATYAYPGANVYGASKAFVRQFSLNLPTFWGRRSVCPISSPALSAGPNFRRSASAVIRRVPTRFMKAPTR